MTTKTRNDMATKTSKHTPGPWRHSTGINKMGDPVERIHIDEKDFSSNMIAVIQSPIGSDFEKTAWYAKNKANAHLIAAAPELLGSLYRLLHEVRMGKDSRFLDEACNEADQAIAKAEGKGE